MAGERRLARGQALVEMALVMPIFVLILMGIMDLGQAVYAGNALADAAREAARHCLTNPPDSAGMEAAARLVAVALDSGQMAIVIAYPDGNTLPGSRLRVQVTYAYRPITPLISAIAGGGPVSLQAWSTMYLE